MSPRRSGPGRPAMRVAIVGAGVMAEAMITGLLADRAVAPDRLVASHPRRDRREILGERHAISVVAKNAEAVRGAYLRGESYAELAERHKVPLNTMRTWLRRSLLKLRDCLER